MARRHRVGSIVAWLGVPHTWLRPLCVFLLLCLDPAPGRATRVVVVSDGSQAALQLLMDGLVGATEPVVVLVPPGEWEMVGQVTLAQHNVTVLGSGPGRTRFFRTHEESRPLFLVQDAANVRFSGLRLEGNADPASTSQEYGIRLNDSTDFRVDHCLFLESGAGGVRTNGATTGVVDHCAFDNIYKEGIANLGYGVVIYGTGTIAAEPYGSARATFIEDSDFARCRHAVASNNGARYVFRYNRVTQNVVSHAVDAHGHEYGSVVGTEWVDVYHNVVEDPAYAGYAVRLRGGTGLVWSNTFGGYTTAVTLTESTDQATGPVHVWGNTLTPAGTMLSTPTETAPLAPADGVPEGLTSAPGSYTPYPYPHPLVVDLQADAGPDQIVVLAPGATEAAVYLDASASTATGGSIVATRWYAGATHLSDCARDIVSLPAGQHLVLVEVERDDGRLEHDLAVVEVIPAAPLASTPEFAARWFVPLVGTAQIGFTMTPSTAAMDGYAALAGRHDVGAHADNALIVRANDTGHLDARNADAYQADNVIPYQPGTAYAVQITLDVAAQRYSVLVDGQILATNYSFRTPEPSLAQLVAWHATGGITITDLALSGEAAQPDPPCQAPPPPDAGLPDGGVTDGGLPVDAPDAPATPDASPDGTTGPGSRVAGCACRAAGRDLSAPRFLPLLFVLVVLRRRP